MTEQSRLLREFIGEALNELHVDQKMRDLLRRGRQHRSMRDVARSKGLTLRWALERDVDLSPEVEATARAAWQGYLRRYGPELAPVALIQFLDRKYGRRHDKAAS